MNNSQHKAIVEAKDIHKFFITQGRTYINDNALQLNHSASSIEGKFIGSVLELQATALYGHRNYATYIRVLLDNKIKKIMVKENTSILTFNLQNGTHAFKIIKLPESKSCTFGIISISCDGQFIKTENNKQLNIEVVGDSISTGYGVAAQSKDAPYLTIHQNADQSFGYLVAKAMNANLNIIGAGGHALYRSRHARTPMPILYGNIDLDRNTQTWDKDLFKPDVIIVELGTNDFSYLRTLEGEEKIKETKKVKTIFIEFLKQILKQKCKIVVLFGFFGDEELKKLTLDVINQVNSNLVSYVETPNIYAINDIKAGHPGKISHKITAELLVDHIKKIL